MSEINMSEIPWQAVVALTGDRCSEPLSWAAATTCISSVIIVSALIAYWVYSAYK
jgi:hypothetical protein